MLTAALKPALEQAHGRGAGTPMVTAFRHRRAAAYRHRVVHHRQAQDGADGELEEASTHIPV